MNLQPIVKLDLVGPLSLVLEGQTITLAEGETRTVLTASGHFEPKTDTGQIGITEIDLDALLAAKTAEIKTPEWEITNDLITSKKARGVALSTSEKDFLQASEAQLNAILSQYNQIKAAVAMGSLPNPLPDLLR